MNMFASFDEIPAMTFKILRKQNVTDGHTDNVKKVYTPQTKFAGDNQWKYRTVKPEMTGRIIKQSDGTHNGPQGLSGTTWPLPITIV